MTRDDLLRLAINTNLRYEGGARPSWSSVSGLFRGGRPATVARFVITIIVDAIKRHVRRRIAHVGIEIFEGLPPIADTNPSAAVSVIRRFCGVLASLLHAAPHVVNRRVSFAVRCVAAGGDQFHLQASAGSGSPGAQPMGWHVGVRSTVTGATPPDVCTAIGFRCLTHYNKAAESLSNEIEFLHSLITRRSACR
jgi:hypothetical protein